MASGQLCPAPGRSFCHTSYRCDHPNSDHRDSCHRVLGRDHSCGDHGGDRCGSGTGSSLTRHDSPPTAIGASGLLGGSGSVFRAGNSDTEASTAEALEEDRQRVTGTSVVMASMAVLSNRRRQCGAYGLCGDRVPPRPWPSGTRLVRLR